MITGELSAQHTQLAAEDSFITTFDLVMREMSKHATPPQLIQYDSWGRRVDELRTSEGWRGLKDIYHREGLVAIPYERKYGEYSRPYGFAKLFLAVGDSEVVSRRSSLSVRVIVVTNRGHKVGCPMSMSDGVARGAFITPALPFREPLMFWKVIELIGSPALQKDIYTRLIRFVDQCSLILKC